MKVYHLTAECYPVAKVGGLADVLGALPKYLNQLGIDAKVVMPWYNKPFTQNHEFELVLQSGFHQNGDFLPYHVLKEKNNTLGFDLYLIRIPNVLEREEVYGYDDDNYRFIAFQHAILHWFCKKKIIPDVIHCHDHHTGLVPFMIKHCPEFEKLNKVKTVGTIHNGQYQGNMSWRCISLLPSFDTWKGGLLDWNDQINPLASMIKCVDAFTTVSNGYLEELYYEANGLESLFDRERGKAHGIINGIDTEIWNPETDPMIEFNYSAKNAVTVKKQNKIALCNTYELNPNLPLISFIGRFAREKGADLLPGIIERTVIETRGKANLMILGSGDYYIENRLKELRHTFHVNFNLDLGYKEHLSHQIYASSDYLLMPSRVEPCGLNQMYAMRYGTIPIVRYTGGLKDTVLDYSVEGGFGVVFGEANVDSVVHSIKRALDLEYDKPYLRKLRKKTMTFDFSWEISAKKYVNLYRNI